MKREIGDIITVEGKEYSILDMVLYEGKDYLFTNLVENDEPTETFFVFQLFDNGKNGSVEIVEDKKILERLIPICSKNIEKRINMMNLQEKYEIN